jgi:hypothetical protein
MRTFTKEIVTLAAICLLSPPFDQALAHGLSETSPPSYSPKRPPRPTPPPSGVFDPFVVEGVVDQFRLWQTGSTLTACFVGGETTQRQFVSETVKSMLVDVNIVIDFGDAPTFRDCGAASHIRVAFDPALGNWSYVGTDSIRISSNQPSMNLGDLAAASLEAPSSRGVVLHEFGHALALQHEHQSPEAQCDREFDWPKIYSVFEEEYGWDKQKVDQNIRSLKNSPRLRVTAYDPSSIMHYYFPPWMYISGENSKCFTGHNNDLSSTDRKILSESYPRSSERQVAEINKRGDFTRHILEKLVSSEEQKAWTSDLVEQAASAAAPGFSFSMVSNTENTGQCAGADMHSEAGDNSIIATCIDAGHDVNIGVPPKPGRDQD